MLLIFRFPLSLGFGWWLDNDNYKHTLLYASETIVKLYTAFLDCICPFALFGTTSKFLLFLFFLPSGNAEIRVCRESQKMMKNVEFLPLKAVNHSSSFLMFCCCCFGKWTVARTRLKGERVKSSSKEVEVFLFQRDNKIGLDWFKNILHV